MHPVPVIGMAPALGIALAGLAVLAAVLVLCLVAWATNRHAARKAARGRHPSGDSTALIVDNYRRRRAFNENSQRHEADRLFNQDDFRSPVSGVAPTAEEIELERVLWSDPDFLHFALVHGFKRSVSS